jgi:hypothetical protein
MSWGGLSCAGVGAGGGISILFQRTGTVSALDTVDLEDGWLIEERIPDYDIRRTMVMPDAAVHMQPLPDFFLHPSASLAIGPAMMVYTNRRYDEEPDETEFSKHSGGYWGWHCTGSLGIHFKIGESGATLFSVLQYRRASVYKRDWDTNVRYRQDMSGPALHAGFQFL